MKQFIELGAVRIGVAIQNVCANVDFEVLSLPGGSLIAILLWFCATAMGSIRRAAKNLIGAICLSNVLYDLPATLRFAIAQFR